MSVVGTTFGIGEKRDPAGDREGRQGRDQRDELGGRPRALVPDHAGDQAEAEQEQRAELPAHVRPSLARSGARPASGEQRDAVLDANRAAVEDPGDLGREVPAAGEHLLGRAVGDHLAAPEQDDPLGERGGELDVVGGDHDRGAARRRARRSGPPARALRARSMPRVGSSSMSRPGASPPGPRARRSRSRARAAGARRRRGRAGRRRRGRSRPSSSRARAPASPRSSSPDPLADQQVVGALGQQRRAARAPRSCRAPARPRPSPR